MATKTWAEWLRYLDNKSKVRQEAIAKGAGVTPRMYSKYLNGETKPSLYRLVVIITLMKLPTQYDDEVMELLAAADYGLQKFFPSNYAEQAGLLSFLRFIEILLRWLYVELDSRSGEMLLHEKKELEELLSTLDVARIHSQEFRLPSVRE